MSAALHQYSVTSPFHGEPLRTYEFGATYYPRDDVSIALWTNGDYHFRVSNGNEDKRGYRLEANWFLSESIALGMSYQTSRDRSNFGDASLVNFGVTNMDTHGLRFNVSWRH